MVSDDPESFADLDGHDPTDGGLVQTLVEVTMDEVDKVAGPLIESAKDSGQLGPAVGVGAALGAATYVLIDSFTQKNYAEANLRMEEAKAANDVALRRADNPQSAQRGRGNKRETQFEHMTDEEVSRIARDKKDPRRRAAQREEKARGTRRSRESKDNKKPPDKQKPPAPSKPPAQPEPQPPRPPDKPGSKE